MSRGIDDEVRRPKYACIERERRWLVDPARRPDLPDECVLIEDRYIAGTRLRLRRRTDTPGDRIVLKLTKKYDSADPLARPIVTAYLSEAEFALFARLPAATLSKRRYSVADGDHRFSIDQFDGALAGLELAEIEAVDDADLRAAPSPHWTTRDVSDDPRYQGGTLAAHGIPEE
jgi:CYTH domain-containing protein